MIFEGPFLFQDGPFCYRTEIFCLFRFDAAVRDFTLEGFSRDHQVIHACLEVCSIVGLVLVVGVEEPDSLVLIVNGLEPLPYGRGFF